MPALRHRPTQGATGHGNRLPVTTHYQVVRDLVVLQDTAGMTDNRLLALAGYERAALRRLRTGRRVNLQTIADLAEVFGYEIRLVKKDDK